MDKLFSGLKKTLVATLFIVFGFVTTYIPINQQGHMPVAEAGGAAGGALEVTQWINKGLIQAGNVYNSVTSAFSAIMQKKEFLWDQAAWLVAKEAMARMTDSIVDWIKSDFEGKPRFVQNIDEMLKDTADGVLGEYIAELGGSASFLCDPFKLDITLALEIEYNNTTRYDVPSCTISGIIDNFDDFANEADRQLSDDSWGEFLVVTSRPRSNTPYGSYLASKNELINETAKRQAEDMQEASWNNGFRSFKNCTQISIPGAVDDPNTGEDESTRPFCEIATPGKVIQDSLNANLDSQRQSWAEADEFGEVLAAMFGDIEKAVLAKGSSLLDM